jgi:hypothetical protein
MTRTPRILFCFVVGTLATASFTSGAYGQSNLPQMVAARGLYEQGVAAMGRQDYEAAYSMLEEAVRLEPAALGAKLALAEAYEAADRLASAWGTYGIVEQEAIKAKHEDRQTRAHDRAAALAPRLAHLVVVVPENVGRLPGLEIKRDGVPVGPGQWSVPLPADKGSHVIVVQASGRTSTWSTFEVLADGVTARAVVSEPPLAPNDISWCDMPFPPPAPRRAYQQLVPLQPPPRPPLLGYPMIHLVGGDRLELREALSQSDSSLVCSAPCASSVDARAHQEFFLGGDGFLKSERFRLDDQLGAVTIYASIGTTARRIGTLVGMVFGGSAMLGCGVWLPIAAQFDGSSALPPLLSTCLGGGLLALAVSIPVYLGNKTTYSWAQPDQAGNLGVFHF